MSDEQPASAEGLKTSAIEPPNHRYYQAVHGRWRSRFELRITNWRRFWRCRMGLLDRLRVLSMLVTAKLLGRAVMETEVDYATRGATEGHVTHELRVKKWGMTFYVSNESLRLDEDGRGVSIEGVQKLFPVFWRTRDFTGSQGTINDAGTSARYSVPWFGTSLEISTQVTSDGTDITMETEWSRGVQLLRPR